MPFTRDEFFQIMELYNADVGRAVWLFYAFAIFVFIQLLKQKPSGHRWALGYLAFLWIWMGVVYQWIYFSQINPVARFFGGFFVLQGLIFAFATWKNWKLEIYSIRSLRGIFQLILISYSLVFYPMIGTVLGHGYPNGPIFGLPCPTTIYTLALLCGLEPSLKKIILLSLIPLIWAVIGTSAAKYFGVTEDYMLGISALAYVIVQLLPRLAKPMSREY